MNFAIATSSLIGFSINYRISPVNDTKAEESSSLSNAAKIMTSRLRGNPEMGSISRLISSFNTAKLAIPKLDNIENVYCKNYQY